jgi:hypothetical protein
VLLPTALLHTGAEERSGNRRADAQRPAEREYARVPGAAPKRDSVEAMSERPALVPPMPAPAEASSEGTHEGPPPGVTTLRLHRPEDDAAESGELPRRVRQASLAPQLREERPEEPAEAPRHRDDEERTPELVRDRMAAYRAGWARGGGRTPGVGATPDPVAGSDSSEGDPA